VCKLRKTKRFYWAIVLLALDIATICVISGLYGGYVNITKLNKVVNLEKWGVSFQTQASTLVNSSSEGDNFSVKSSDEWKVVAPGSGGILKAPKITGTSEGSGRITTKSTITIKDIDKWTIINENKESMFYCPIVFTIGNNTYKIWEMEPTSIEDNDYIYEPNIPDITFSKGAKLSSYKIDDISWSWDYENEDDIPLYDKYDTALADFENSDDAPSFKVDIVVTATWDTVPESVPEPEPEPIVDDTPTETPTDTPTDTPIENGNSGASGTVTASPRYLYGDTQDETETELTEQETLDNDGLTLSGNTNTLTGDNFNMVFWVTLMVLALVAIIAVIILITERRKKETNIESHENENK
jgi:hypothetical protein